MVSRRAVCQHQLGILVETQCTWSSGKYKLGYKFVTMSVGR